MGKGGGKEKGGGNGGWRVTGPDPTRIPRLKGRGRLRAGTRADSGWILVIVKEGSMPYVHYAMGFGPGKLEEYEKMVAEMDSIERPFLAKFGGKMLGRWKVTIGQVNQVISLYYYKDLGDRDKLAAELRRDKVWKERTPRIYATIATSTISVLEAIGASPIAEKVEEL